MILGNWFDFSSPGTARHGAWLACALLLLGGCKPDVPRAPQLPPSGVATPSTSPPSAPRPTPSGPMGKAEVQSPPASTLDPNARYGVYYYDGSNKVLLVEDLKPPHTRQASAPTGSVPPLAAVCDPSLPSKPANCAGNSCPVSVMAKLAVYYGPGSGASDPVVAGVEQGPFTGRSIDWPVGSGCSPACARRCCVPSLGGCICIC